uniref:Uncharacterized protein n=1 Tax=Ditylenchus dipsaci TaxID=166011 RepID=A0A915CPQ6_9BILA
MASINTYALNLKVKGKLLLTRMKNVEETSTVSFAANYIQSRIVSTELGTKLVKLYETLDVKSKEDYDHKLAELSAGGGEVNSSKSSEETVKLIKELNVAFTEWEDFLHRIEKELDKIAGPNNNTTNEIGSTDNIHLVSQNKMFKNGTLLSYVQNSSFNMMFLEVVASFSVQENYEHVKKVFDHLTDFHKLDCDILLLTKRPATDGGGFLKLIGMPFRMLLNEKDSMKQILSHRQSVILLAGVKAIHIYTEFVCNEHSLEISKHSEEGARETEDSSDVMYSVLGSQSGCVLIDRKGRILYSYLCSDITDWPDVEVLLEQVRINRRQSGSAESNGKTSSSTENVVPGDKEGDAAAIVAANTTTTTTVTDPRVTVYKKKCCTIL